MLEERRHVDALGVGHAAVDVADGHQHAARIVEEPRHVAADVAEALHRVAHALERQAHVLEDLLAHHQQPARGGGVTTPAAVELDGFAGDHRG